MEKNRLPVAVETYGSLIKAASKSGKLNKYQLAISLHDEMRIKEIRSNVRMYTFLISLAPDFEQAFKLCEQMVIEKDEKNRSIKPNERTKMALDRQTRGKSAQLHKISMWYEQHR